MKLFTVSCNAGTRSLLVECVSLVFPFLSYGPCCLPQRPSNRNMGASFLLVLAHALKGGSAHRLHAKRDIHQSPICTFALMPRLQAMAEYSSFFALSMDVSVGSCPIRSCCPCSRFSCAMVITIWRTSSEFGPSPTKRINRELYRCWSHPRCLRTA